MAFETPNGTGELNEKENDVFILKSDFSMSF